MVFSRLTLWWEDEIRIISSYSVLLVTWSPCTVLLKCVDVLFIPALFLFIHNYSKITLVYSRLFPNYSGIIPE